MWNNIKRCLKTIIQWNLLKGMFHLTKYSKNNFPAIINQVANGKVKIKVTRLGDGSVGKVLALHA